MYVMTQAVTPRPAATDEETLVALTRQLMSDVAALGTIEAQRLERRLMRTARHQLQTLAVIVVGASFGLLGVALVSVGAVFGLVQVGLPLSLALLATGGASLILALLVLRTAQRFERRGPAPQGGSTL